MKEIIPVGDGYFGGEKVNTVNARDLHAFLGVGKDFSNWIKHQIERARLKEDRDYVTAEVLLALLGEQTGRGGHNRIDYFLTIDAAKHIAMSSGTEKGYEVRDYFIECERRANNPAMALRRIDLFRMGLEAEERAIAAEAANKELAGQVEVLAPKADALDRLSNCDGNLCIRDAAKMLQVGERVLIGELAARNWTYRRPGNSKPLIGRSEVLSRGLLTHKGIVIKQADGEEKLREQVLITPKGLARLAEVFSTKPEPKELAPVAL